jgi:cytidine deaminase
MCAERVAVGAAVAAGERRFRRLVLVTDAPTAVAPCGACRAVLREFGPGLQVESYDRSGSARSWSIDELLPSHFELPSAVTTSGEQDS